MDTNQQIMSQPEEFRCEFCDKKFSTKSNLKTHLRSAKRCIMTRTGQPASVSVPETESEVSSPANKEMLWTVHMDMKKLNAKIDTVSTILQSHAVKLQDLVDKAPIVGSSSPVQENDKSISVMLKYIIGTLNDVKTGLNKEA